MLDGENKIDNLVNKVKELGMKQVALTDHGVLMGSLNFYKACKKVGIKPILGCESYITEDPDDLPKEARKKDNYHLVLIAHNNTGWKNLVKLASQAQLHNFYHKPRISKHNMTRESLEGLTASSACLGSNLNREGGWDPVEKKYTNIDRMYELAAWYRDRFDNTYHLEIQDNPDSDQQQKTYNELLIKIGKDLHIPIVITSDAHYTTVQDAETHSVLMAMQLKKTLQDYKSAGEMKYGPWFYIRSPEEMLAAARKYNCEEAFWNACKIGNSCQVDLELGNIKMPSFDITTDPDYQEFLQKRHIHE